jgi:nucleotide-binding universal stress UspA family protein
MDLSKLKKRPSYPFENIGVAIGFSPNLLAILAEAKMLADTLKSNLFLFHIGEKTADKEEALEKILRESGIDIKKIRVMWMDGEPVDTLLKLCKLNAIDLLIMGALKKENLFRYYLGSIARSFSRKAKCSVLLVTDPTVPPRKPKKVVVNGVENLKTKHTINTAFYLSRNLGITDISIVKETHMPGLAMTIAESATAPEVTKIKKEYSVEDISSLHSIVESCHAEGLNVKEKVVTGKPGYAIRAYAESRKADLLVINSPDTHLNILDRIFTHDMEYILEDLPCDLLIVHSRV